MRTLPALLILSLVVITGCFTADVTIKDDASGKIDVTYDPVLPTKEDAEKKLWSGAGLTLETFKITETAEGERKKQSVHAVVAFKDVGNFQNAKRLRRFRTTIKDAADGSKELTVLLSGKEQKGFSHPQPVTIRLHLPGDVIETSAEKKDARTVVWSFPAKDFFYKKELTMTARYKVAAADAAEAEPEKKAEN